MADPMPETLEVIYNDTCPICAREVAVYMRKTGETVRYHGLSDPETARFGLSTDALAREFHVMHRGELVAGLPAFALLWARIPRMRWLARLVQLPVLAPMLDWGYRHIAARALYGLHRRRQARQGVGCNREVSR